MTPYSPRFLRVMGWLCRASALLAALVFVIEVVRRCMGGDPVVNLAAQGSVAFGAWYVADLQFTLANHMKETQA